MNTYSIYALCDPITGEVRYIGATQDIGTRLQNHIRGTGHSDNRRAWMQELKAQKLHPILAVLEGEVQEKEVVEREQYWISQYLAQGANLLNMIVFDPNRPKTNALQHVVVVTQSQYDRYKNAGKNVDIADFHIVRRTQHDNRSYFSLNDLMVALKLSSAQTYWSVLKLRLRNEGLEDALEEIVQLKLKAFDGKLRLTDCAKRECMVKIILNIPNRDIKPVQQWFIQMLIEKPEEIIQIFPD